MMYTTNVVIGIIERAASRRLNFSVKLIVDAWQNVPSWATWHEEFNGGDEFVGVLVKERELDEYLIRTGQKIC